uniref:Uncharacterized protein n=1 Tax=Pelusios castaneus TaxID=367368 RepID=A0A8C8VQC9_9SAUR
MQGRMSSPPDGGYGWVVVVSAFFVMGLTAAVLKTFGLFFVEIQQHFDELTSTTSWITSITIAMFHLGAAYVRDTVVIFGGLLAFSGMTLGVKAFSAISGHYCLDTIIWSNLTNFFLSPHPGLGISFSWTPAISLVSHYFSNRRALANAVASAGECAFAFTFGPFFQWLIALCGWKSALLIIGGIQLNICVCGALMRPLKDCCVPEAKSSETQRPSAKEHASPTAEKPFNWMLVKRLDFMLYAILGVLAAMSFFIPPLFLVPLSYSLGIDESWTASLLSIFAIVDFLGRLLCDWYVNLHLTKTIHLLTMTVVLISVSLMLLPLANNYLSLAMFTGFYGFFFGTTVSLHITVLTDVTGMSDFDSALVLFMLIRSTGGFLGPSLAGKSQKRSLLPCLKSIFSYLNYRIHNAKSLTKSYGENHAPSSPGGNLGPCLQRNWWENSRMNASIHACPLHTMESNSMRLPVSQHTESVCGRRGLYP